MVNAKRGLTSKIFFLFFTVIILAFGFVTVVVIYSVQNISQQEIYFRLNTYCNITYAGWSEGVPINPSNDTDYKYGIIQGNLTEDGAIVEDSLTTSNIDIYLDDQEFINFIDSVKQGSAIYTTNSKGNLFYAYKVDEARDNFIIMLVDDIYSTMFSKKIIIPIVVIFIFSMVVISFIVFLWVSKHVKRLKQIQTHVRQMNKENYEVPYIDNGDDEIADLSRSIEEMRLEIKESETTKREMLQNISHDFKTPIAVIKNYGESIEDGILVEEGAKVIIKQADILKSKVNQLLQYNRLEYLSNDEEFVEVNLKDICNEVANNYKMSSNIKFELNLEDCYFKGYRENFTTVIGNIIDNALRYAKTKIVITTKKNKLTIYNDGEPIDEKFLNANFKPYEKGSNGQFGLGMSIVKKTLDFFDLKLQVYNESYGGVSFVISKED